MSLGQPARASSARRGFAALALTLWLAEDAVAQEPAGPPLWEVGALGLAAWLPDYPAADQSHLRWLVLPRIVYRGPILQLGEKGLIRGLLVETERVELDVSLAGSFPADSDHNRARRGMPDLDWLGEVGPRLTLGLLGDRERSGLSLDLQARGVFSTDLASFDFRGLLLHPELVWRERTWFPTGPWLEARVGPIVGDERLMDYFYEVEPRFATAGRPAFDAGSGYLGSFLRARLDHPLLPRVALGLDLSMGLHSGASNQDSPLFRDELTFGLATSLVWTFWQSERRRP